MKRFIDTMQHWENDTSKYDTVGGTTVSTTGAGRTGTRAIVWNTVGNYVSMANHSGLSYSYNVFGVRMSVGSGGVYPDRGIALMQSGIVYLITGDAGKVELWLSPFHPVPTSRIHLATTICPVFQVVGQRYYVEWKLGAGSTELRFNGVTVLTHTDGSLAANGLTLGPSAAQSGTSLVRMTAQDLYIIDDISDPAGGPALTDFVGDCYGYYLGAEMDFHSIDPFYHNDWLGGTPGNHYAQLSTLDILGGGLHTGTVGDWESFRVAALSDGTSNPVSMVQWIAGAIANGTTSAFKPLWEVWGTEGLIDFDQTFLQGPFRAPVRYYYAHNTALTGAGGAGPRSRWEQQSGAAVMIGMSVSSGSTGAIAHWYVFQIGFELMIIHDYEPYTYCQVSGMTRAFILG